MDPIDTIDVPKIDCYIGKYEKPDIFLHILIPRMELLLGIKLLQI